MYTGLSLSGLGWTFQSWRLARVPKGIRVHGALGLVLEDSVDLGRDRAYAGLPTLHTPGQSGFSPNRVLVRNHPPPPTLLHDR